MSLKTQILEAVVPSNNGVPVDPANNRNDREVRVYPVPPNKGRVAPGANYELRAGEIVDHGVAA